MMLQPVSVIAARLGADERELAFTLDRMSRRGLIFRSTRKGQTLYMAAQFVIGIWEYHVNSLDEELIRDVNAYFPVLFDGKTWKDAPQLRTIPVGQSLAVEHQALPYEHAEQLIEGKRKYLVAPCICRNTPRIRLPLMMVSTLL